MWELCSQQRKWLRSNVLGTGEVTGGGICEVLGGPVKTCEDLRARLNTAPFYLFTCTSTCLLSIQERERPRSCESVEIQARPLSLELFSQHPAPKIAAPPPSRHHIPNTLRTHQNQPW